MVRSDQVALREELRATALAAWAHALAEAAPGPRVAEALARLPSWLANRPRYVVAIGKAAFTMLEGAAEGGWVAGVAVGAVAEGAALPRWPAVTVRLGAHPLPDATSVEAAELLQSFVAAVPADGLLLALISGGASAMVAKPIAGVTLAQKIERTAQQMASGASIAELNAMRRSLSSVKGGQLVASAAAPVLTLIVTVSASARDLAEAHATTPTSTRADDRWSVIANQDAVARAAADWLVAQGWAVQRIDEPLVATVEEVADRLATTVRAGAASGRRHAVVAFGEPSVRLPASRAGRGGRAQQLALLLARQLDGSAVTALIAGTDGVDGPTRPPVAGAIVDGSTWARLRVAGATGFDGAAAIAACDARPALEAVASLLVTGPTGLNHSDVMILVTSG
jgi:glycerate 2-kinase